MEYTELDDSGQAEFIRGAIRGFEQQHRARLNDQRRYQGYLEALDRGEFKDIMDSRVKNAKRTSWQQQRDDAAMDVQGFEIDIMRLRADLAELPFAPSTEDTPVEG